MVGRCSMLHNTLGAENTSTYVFGRHGYWTLLKGWRYSGAMVGKVNFWPFSTEKNKNYFLKFKKKSASHLILLAVSLLNESPFPPSHTHTHQCTPWARLRFLNLSRSIKFSSNLYPRCNSLLVLLFSRWAPRLCSRQPGRVSCLRYHSMI